MTLYSECSASLSCSASLHCVAAGFCCNQCNCFTWASGWTPGSQDPLGHSLQNLQKFAWSAGPATLFGDGMMLAQAVPKKKTVKRPICVILNDDNGPSNEALVPAQSLVAARYKQQQAMSHLIWTSAACQLCGQKTVHHLALVLPVHLITQGSQPPL